MLSSLNLRSCLIYAATLLFITAAVCFSLLRAALPHAHGYVSELEATLSGQAGSPVNIRAIDAEMSWFTPRLILLDVQVRDEEDTRDLLNFERIELSLSWLRSLSSFSLRIAEINLVFSELLLERLEDGSWSVQGIALQSRAEVLPDDLRELLEQTDFLVTGNRVSLQDHTGEYPGLAVEDVNMSVSHFLGEHTLIASMPLPDDLGRELTFSVSYSGNIETLLESEAEVYVAVDDMDLERLQQHLRIDTDIRVAGRHDIEFWSSLSSLRPQSVSASIQSLDIVVSRGQAAWRADELTAMLQWQRDEDDWSLQVRNLSYSRDSFRWRNPTDLSVIVEDGSIELESNYLDFRDVADIAQLAATEEAPAWLDQLTRIAPETELFDVVADIDTTEPAASRVSFIAQNLGYAGVARSVSGLDLAFGFSEGSGRAVVVTGEAVYTDREMFREAIAIERLDTTISIGHQAGSWTLGSDLVELENADVSIRSRIFASWREDAGLLLDMQARIPEVSGADISAYYPVSELEPELVGWLDTAINDGRVEDAYFLFHGAVRDYPFSADGKLLAGFDVSGLNLRFNEDWPALQDLHAYTLFEDRSMTITGRSARQLGASVKKLQARIADLYVSQLVIDGEISTPVHDVQRYIWSSPLDAKLGEAMSQLSASGDASLKLAMTIPLEDVDRMTLRGDLDFAGAAIEYPTLEYRFTDVAGRLSFDLDSVWSEELRAAIDGQRMDIDIDSERDDRGSFTSIHTSVEIPVDTLLGSFDRLPERWFSGRSPWDIRLTIPHYDSDHDVLVDATSTLHGVRADVSDHVNKQADVDYPVHIAARVSGADIRLEGELPDGQHVYASRTGGSQWTLDIDTRYLAGDIRFDDSFAIDSTLEFDLARLDIGALTTRAAGSDGRPTIDPATIPSIRFKARDVDWMKLHADSVELQTSRHSHGMLISKLAIAAPDLDISGQGSWLTSWRQPHVTSLTLTASSKNFGNALAGQDYKRVLDRCSQTTQLELRWPREPFNFSWVLLEGSAEIDMRDGIVSDVDAGSGGRLVGLLNVFHLPRRLLFDFSDLKGDGFAFDSIKSRFEFADGFMRTTDTDIEASIADMRITGSVDMESEEYDLVVRVKPNQTAATFTGGAIAGGAAVGAGLVLLQKLLNLDKAIQDRYTITGSWNAPTITRVEKSDLVAPPAEDAGAESDDLDTSDEE